MKKPGKQLIAAGSLVAGIGAVMSFMALMSTHVDNYGVETQGAPSPAAIIMVITGLILGGIGLARRTAART